MSLMSQYANEKSSSKYVHSILNDLSARKCFLRMLENALLNAIFLDQD